MVRSTLSRLAIAGLCAAAFLSSCKKSHPEPANPGDSVITDTNALRLGKGFGLLHMIFPPNLTTFTGARNGASDNFRVADMMMDEDGTILNVAALETMGTVLADTHQLSRVRINPATGSMLATPTSNLSGIVLSRLAADLGEVRMDTRNYGYQPGTGRFYHSTIDDLGSDLARVSVSGDFSYTRGPAGFARRPRITASGLVVEDVMADVVNRPGGGFNNRIYFSYRAGNQATYTYQAERAVEFNEDAIRNGAVVPLRDTGTTSPLLLFLVSKKKLFVAQAPATSPAADPITLTWIDSLTLPAGVLWGIPPGVAVRYTPNSDKVAVAVSSFETNPTFLTAVYSKSARRLTLNIPGRQIPNFAAASVRWDMDPDANLYFNNRGSGFQSATSTSLYRLSGSAVTLLGQDDILRHGAIQSVRWHGGKVYAAVAYNFRKSSAAGAKKQFRIAVVAQL